MQVGMRRSNQDRTEATRRDLIAAARRLFVETSFSATSTPQIVRQAGVTRGALYHHFKDKEDLFRAVVEREAAAVAEEIERAAPDGLPSREALVRGGDAFLAAMGRHGRTRLLLLDGPAVLGRRAMDEIDARHGTRALRAGLAAAMRHGDMRRIPLDALTALLSAAFDRAALSIDAGTPVDDCRAALAALIDGVMTERRAP